MRTFVTAAIDIQARFGLDPATSPRILDQMAGEIGNAALRLLYPTLIPLEAELDALEGRVDVTGEAEGWRLMAQYSAVCPISLYVTSETGVSGVRLTVMSGAISRHDQLALVDALEDVLKAATMGTDPT